MPINPQASAAQYQRGLNYPTRLSRTDSKVVDTALVTVNMQVVADDAARFATGLQAGGLAYQVNNSTFYEFSGIFSGVDNLSVAGDWAAVQFGSLEWQSSAITNLLTPPGSPIDGDRYLIGTLTTDIGTGDWATHQTEIAQYNGNTASWDFTVPVVGATISLDDEPQAFYQFGGTDWAAKNFEQTTASGILQKSGFDITVVTDSIVDSYVNTAAGIETSKTAHTQAVTGDWTAADGATGKVHLDEVGSRLTATESATSTNTTHSTGDGSDHADVATNTTHRGLTSGNPHNVTASDLTLGNVTNVATDDTAYNAGTWDSNSDSATKNALRDKFEADKLLIDANTTEAALHDFHLTSPAASTDSMTVEPHAMTGDRNTLFGINAGLNLGAGEDNVCIGHGAGDDIFSGNGDNVCIGSLTSTGNSSRSVAIGYNCTSDQNSVAIGEGANVSAGQSTGVGRLSVASASSSTAIGYQAACSATNTVAVGNASVSAGTGTVSIGVLAGTGSTSTECVYIGHNAGNGNSTSHRLIIENTSNISTPLIDGLFESAGGDTGVTINGRLVVNGGFNPRWLSETIDYEALAGDRILADTAATAAFTITLPASASEGDQISIADAASNFATDNITIDRNAHNIMGSASDLILNVDDQPITLVYYNVAQGWILGSA